MNAAQRNRHAALLKATGYEDGPALTLQSSDGEIPHGRELSFAWLAGTVMTGLTSVLLMGAALFVSFQGQDTFSTAYDALTLALAPEEAASAILVKTDRVKPVAQTRSELEIIEASIRDTVDGRDIIRNEPFSRLRATLATAATALSDDIPDYDPVAILEAGQPIDDISDEIINTDIYGAEVEGEVAVRLAAFPLSMVPPRAVSDQMAALFARQTVEEGFFSDESVSGYASTGGEGGIETLRELGSVSNVAFIEGEAENITIWPKSTLVTDAALGSAERFVTVRESESLEALLRRNGFADDITAAVLSTIDNVARMRNFDIDEVEVGDRLAIKFGPAPGAAGLVPLRLAIYQHIEETDTDVPVATIARDDEGRYVIGVDQTDIVFPDEDVEEINVNNLPSIYRAIWETGRKHELADDTIERIISMYAYDVEMTRRIEPGDSIEILQTAPDENGEQDLLYVNLSLGANDREFFRFRTEDGVVDFYDPDGETGKRFLTRRPLEGGGTLRSRYGYRIHPILGGRRLHAGVDLAAPTGTPIYASGDGVIEMAQWNGGYGRYIAIEHVNGFETAYGHMSRIADGIRPGVRVRQGQIIGYVGSTGQSTGPHLHFEIKVNGRTVDPLSVQLPRDKVLAQQYVRQFEQTVSQIRDLMTRDPEPVTIASIN